MQDEVDQVVISAETIHERLRELARQLTADYAEKPLTVVIVANGALFFAADLLRLIPLPLELDSIGVASYIGTQSEALKLRSDLKADVRDRHVLVVDDIFDTGRTLTAILAHLQRRGPRSVRTCVLLAKDVPHETQLRPDYCGFRIADQFVVGYGLDWNERYRNLPYVAVLKGHAAAVAAAGNEEARIPAPDR